MSRRPPPKSRATKQTVRVQPDKRTNERVTPGFSSNVASQIEEHGYGSGHGPFGFTQTTLP